MYWIGPWTAIFWLEPEVATPWLIRGKATTFQHHKGHSQFHQMAPGQFHRFRHQNIPLPPLKRETFVGRPRQKSSRRISRFAPGGWQSLWPEKRRSCLDFLVQILELPNSSSTQTPASQGQLLTSVGRPKQIKQSTNL